MHKLILWNRFKGWNRAMILILCLTGMFFLPLPASANPKMLVIRDTPLHEHPDPASRILDTAKRGWLLEIHEKSGQSSSTPATVQWYEVSQLRRTGEHGFACAFRLYNLPGENPFVRAGDVMDLPEQGDVIQPGEDAYTPAADTIGEDLPADNWLLQAGRCDFSRVLHVNDPLAFIGADRQRLRIHFSSVSRNPDNPWQYLVTGKTLVKKNLCRFSGTITLNKAGLYNKSGKDTEWPASPQGFVSGDAVLKEEKEEQGSGEFRGILTCYFVLDAKGNPAYDDLAKEADGYCNRFFTGSWTSYKTGKSRICNFGDGRIPEDGLPKDVAADQGAGEFVPMPEMLDRGWASYEACRRGNKQACRGEAAAWWK